MRPSRVARTRSAMTSIFCRCGSPGEPSAISAKRAGLDTASAASDSTSSREAGVSPSSRVIVRAMRSAESLSHRRACSAWVATAWRVTSAVTNGLPSRSPPTQDPNVTNAGTGVGTDPLASPTRVVSVAR